MDHSSAINQWVGNIFSIGAIAATFLGWVPGIAAVVALCWYVIQIYESATVQRWLAARRLRKIAALRARIVLLEALGRMPLLQLRNDNDEGD